MSLWVLGLLLSLPVSVTLWAVGVIVVKTPEWTKVEDE